jgi:hypothetical protein
MKIKFKEDEEAERGPGLAMQHQLLLETLEDLAG